MRKRTKILATLGPASDDLQIMEELVRAGVNAFRMNFSHGTHEYHAQNLTKIRQIEKKLNTRIGVFQDISGPKVRVGKLEGIFKLNSSDKLIFIDKEIIGRKKDDNSYELSINHPQILNLINVGEYIYLCDGAIRAKVVEVQSGKVVAILENSGILTSNKGVNFPNTRLNIDVITDKDYKDLEWGVKNNVNFVAVSFVQTAHDVIKVRKILDSLNSKARIFAKIEKFDAVENIDEIIEVSDGIMVARGDLGIEVPFYEVPKIQKMIIKKANLKSKPVITATQMMLSMTENERATRAEISDVANAVLDGTDVVMLSEESAVGKHPVSVVEAMCSTIAGVEAIYNFNQFDHLECFDETDMITSSAVNLANNLKANALLSITSSGKSAIKLARNRPYMDIYAIAHDEDTAHALTLVWGVNPILVIPNDNINRLLGNIITKAYDENFINNHSTYVMTAGFQTGVSGSTNYIRIIKKDQIDSYRNTHLKRN